MARECGPPRSRKLFYSNGARCNWMAHTPVGHDKSLIELSAVDFGPWKKLAGSRMNPPSNTGVQALCGLPSSPALGIVFSGIARIGNGRNGGAEFHLLVALDGCLLRAAAFFAPDRHDVIADLDIGTDDAQSQHGALVMAVAGEHREADGLPALHDLVVGRRRIVGQRQVDDFVD